mgnify:CR=1 FL=1
MFFITSGKKWLLGKWILHKLCLQIDTSILSNLIPLVHHGGVLLMSYEYEPIETCLILFSKQKSTWINFQKAKFLCEISSPDLHSCSRILYFKSLKLVTAQLGNNYLQRRQWQAILFPILEQMLSMLDRSLNNGIPELSFHLFPCLLLSSSMNQEYHLLWVKN